MGEHRFREFIKLVIETLFCNFERPKLERFSDCQIYFSVQPLNDPAVVSFCSIVGFPPVSIPGKKSPERDSPSDSTI